MKLRYSGNIMPFEDSMKKVSAITWASSGKKIAVGAADRVNLTLFSLSISSMTMDRKKISFPPNHQIKARRVTSSEVFNSPLIPKRSLLLKATTSCSFTR